MRLIELVREVKERFRAVRNDPECPNELTGTILDALISLKFDTDEWAEIERLEG